MDQLKQGIRVAVIAAMRAELRPIVTRLSLRPEGDAGARLYRGRAGSHEVVAAVTRMGTRAAARVSARLLDAVSVEHVIVVGIAGGIDPGVRIGELVSPEAVVDEATGAAFHPTPLGGAAPRGKLLTGDALHDDPADLERLRRDGFVAVDMETAAIGAAAEARGVPWSVFRAISDRAGEPGVDREVFALARPDGTPDPAAVARFVLTRPWRLPGLVALARGSGRAIRTSTQAVLRALGG